MLNGDTDAPIYCGLCTNDNCSDTSFEMSRVSAFQKKWMRFRSDIKLWVFRFGVLFFIYYCDLAREPSGFLRSLRMVEGSRPNFLVLICSFYFADLFLLCYKSVGRQFNICLYGFLPGSRYECTNSFVRTLQGKTSSLNMSFASFVLDFFAVSSLVLKKSLWKH